MKCNANPANQKPGRAKQARHPQIVVDINSPPPPRQHIFHSLDVSFVFCCVDGTMLARSALRSARTAGIARSSVGRTAKVQ